MIIAVDFDGTVVEEGGRKAGEAVTPLRFRRGALLALRSLRAAGHVLVLSSSRCNLALRENPALNPLVKAGVVKVDLAQWRASRPVHEARYQQMVDAAARAPLALLFHAVDDGRQGKISADLYIDNNGVRLGHGGVGAHTWEQIAMLWGRVYRRPTQARSV